MRLVLTIQGRALVDFADRLNGLAGGRARVELAQALDQAGSAIRQKTVVAETGQTGLKGAIIDRAQREVGATADRLVYTITSRGGDVRMKFFGAQETGRGVSAHPWGTTIETPGAFIRAGWGTRVSLPWRGEVKQRVGRSRLPLRTIKSGLFIPTEMTTGKTAAEFQTGAAAAASVVISRLGALL